MSRNDFLKLIGLFLFVFILWALGAFLIDKNINAENGDIKESFNLRGVFGDKFGAINTLFSGFAFAGIICTLLIQIKDSKLKRFESTFFELLRLHNDILSKIDFIGKNGREAFDAFNKKIIYSDIEYLAYKALSKLERAEIRQIGESNELTQKILDKLDESDKSNLAAFFPRGEHYNGRILYDNYLDETIGLHKQKIQNAYTKASSENIDNYLHYFRNLFNILKFIDESTVISFTEKNNYVRIIKSQLSEAELFSIFYNSLTNYEIPGRKNLELGYPNMRILLKKYKVLDSISSSTIIHPKHQEIFDQPEVKK